jgi:hypothetical protein
LSSSSITRIRMGSAPLCLTVKSYRQAERVMITIR